MVETTADKKLEAAAASRQKRKVEYITRFNVSQRVEHIILMVTFVALAVTGLAEKFYAAGWAEWLINSMGGIASVRLVHRAFGVIFVISLIYHFGFILYKIGFHQGKLTMLFNLKDLRDIRDSLRYSFGLRDKPTMFGRYDYRQKFEYWGILFGGTIMIITGIILMYPMFATSFLPGQFVAAARVAHGNEAMLAVITIAIWHLYDVMFKPSIFPADVSIFTGKISQERMLEEHALEYAELRAKNIDLESQPTIPETNVIASNTDSNEERTL